MCDLRADQFDCAAACIHPLSEIIVIEDLGIIS